MSEQNAPIRGAEQDDSLFQLYSTSLGAYREPLAHESAVSGAEQEQSRAEHRASVEERRAESGARFGFR
jgi:hypothetical protein